MVRKTYGLDRPLPVQYADWLGRTVRGDFGESLYFKTAAAPLILSKLPTTLLLGMLSLAFALAISIPLGVLAAFIATAGSIASVWRWRWSGRRCRTSSSRCC